MVQWNNVCWGSIWMFDCMKKPFSSAFSSFPAVFAHVYFLVRCRFDGYCFILNHFHRGLIYLKTMFGLAPAEITALNCSFIYRIISF